MSVGLRLMLRRREPRVRTFGPGVFDRAQWPPSTYCEVGRLAGATSLDEELGGAPAF
jgi:hypothetical protein